MRFWWWWYHIIPPAAFEESCCTALTTHRSAPQTPSSQITVYIRASILIGACTHVPDIKLLMKYLPGLQGLMQPAPKPPLSPWNISEYSLVSPLLRKDGFSNLETGDYRPFQTALALDLCSAHLSPARVQKGRAASLQQAVWEVEHCMIQ